MSIKKDGTEKLPLHLRIYAYLCRTHLDWQQVRIGAKARLKKLTDAGADPEDQGLRILQELADTASAQEKLTLKRATALFETHALWQWCLKVKGLGPVAALTFLGFINPMDHTTEEGVAKVRTAGDVWSYAGMAPGRDRMISGQKARFNPHFKGRVLGVVVTSILQQLEPYYYPLYLRQKHYYQVTRGMAAYIDDPTLCPQYEDCNARLTRAAKRQNRKAKKPSCRGHIDNMAKRWLAKLLLSHALEKMRLNEGLDVSHLHSHRGYIPPKPMKGWVEWTDPLMRRLIEEAEAERAARRAAREAAKAEE